ncbi:uncharacterized protein LOC127845819 [Dreissena polymorpha]|uniref:LRAT domain-containing protein n=1 Tax=Dreissena polymorpha TaxID=45954 RepID=A0A9D4IIF5_DREPO|nr:uncharacterized protein LOC127845819 [Dreissena polymorpha]KAH3775430.1 hypothetical protein DPMN_176832 [Dreissena polymorpha]
MALLTRIHAFECSDEGIEECLERPLLNNEKEYLKAERSRVVFTPKKYNTTNEGFQNEPEHAFPVRGNCTTLNENSIGCLKPGDHVAWQRTYVIWHHAIVLKINTSNRMILVAHWKKVNDEQSTYQITEEWVPSSQNGQFYRIDYENEISTQNPTALVIYRARCEKGKTNYKLLNNNCESFATYCKTGQYESSQEHWFWHNIKQAIVEASSALCKYLVTVGGDFAREMSNMTLVEVRNKYISGTVAFAETVEKLKNATNIVGAAIVVSIEGFFLIWDLSKMYERRRDGRISKNTFLDFASQRFCIALFGAGLCIGGSVVGATLGGALGGLAGSVVPLVGTAYGATIGAFLGSVIGGVLSGIIGRALGALVGPYVSKVFKKRDDRKTDISAIKTGDHIVVYGNMFHQNCNAIVIERSGTTITVIRNTYSGGVVEEEITINDGDKVSKKEYSQSESYDPAVVVIRAKSQIGQQYYSYWSNDCERFAYWCKAKN